WFLGLSALFLGLSALATALLLRHLGGPTLGRRLAVENYPRVRVGMPQAEVEALLGGPPGNYSRPAGGEAARTGEGFTGPPESAERVWRDDANRFEIYFDAEGRVVAHHRRAGISSSHPRGSSAGCGGWRVSDGCRDRFFSLTPTRSRPMMPPWPDPPQYCNRAVTSITL